MTIGGACLFVFSSRSRHTSFDCDWSSDVCSSDLWLLAGQGRHSRGEVGRGACPPSVKCRRSPPSAGGRSRPRRCSPTRRSEEHTSELQSQSNLVCRLLLEKKNARHLPFRAIQPAL